MFDCGEVGEALDGGGYTYVLCETGKLSGAGVCGVWVDLRGTGDKTPKPCVSSGTR